MARDSIVKTSVNLSTSVLRALRRLATRRGVTMTEALRQAIGTEVFLDDTQQAGGKVLVEDKRGRVRQLIFR